jgi:hypothetical protein
MRNIEINEVEINGKQYPIYCDLNVLELIQDNFVSINQFERDILGLTPIKDENGELVRDDNGALKQMQGEPKIKAIAFGLYVMIREGQRIKQRETGEEVEYITQEDIREGCRESFLKLSEIVRTEFNRCFIIKKKENNRKKTSRSMTQ